ncbi:bifunctional heptose 7-phosphate kinase/heptose 1-phosphate adenyltransferase [Sulfurovum sp. NBC37-1]|uniref:bifunctional heptose 7-phosphate kinase/heptose 1-phosphate adenyltransferase n=1 Tax=Sulfurovum sp. (strain NBC37-1) TaxID=387093 RepID=UPI000318587F
MDKIRAKDARIAVVGDLMIDHYILGECERISPEAPVQVLGGEDANAALAEQLLSHAGANCDTVIQQEKCVTTRKSRVITSNQQIIRFDDESREDISLGSQYALLTDLQKNIFSYDVVLLSDYGKGVLTPTLTRDIISPCQSPRQTGIGRSQRD